MPIIFEAFGYRLGDTSEEAVLARRAASCVFMGMECDGGGNRFSTQISLAKDGHEQLAALYEGRHQLMPGVCSIQAEPSSPPWIVCPRRLLALAGLSGSQHQQVVERQMIAKLGFPVGTRLGVWREVNVNAIRYDEPGNGEQRKIFEYNFDYVIFPIGRSRLEEISKVVKLNPGKVRSALIKSGYTLANRDGETWVEDFAVLPTETFRPFPGIIEIMTSSTSGGNKKNRTTIPQAFEDAMLGRPHQAPGINKRQVWARMVSQLVVKSEVGNAWGGKTLWLVQDVLAKYIKEATGLNLDDFVSSITDEVNILSFRYPAQVEPLSGPLSLEFDNLYAGPISGGNDGARGFEAIIRTPFVPRLDQLIVGILRSKRGRQLVA